VRPAIVRAGVLSCQLLGKSSGLDNATSEAVHGTEGGHTSGSIIRVTKTLQPQASTGVNFADPANQKAIT